MLFSEIDWIVIFMCVPVWLAVNGVWHSTWVMNGPAQRLTGITSDQNFGREQWGLIPIALISAFTISVVLNWYRTSGGGEGWLAGVAVGGMLWAGVIVPVRLLDFIYRPYKFEIFLLEITNLLIVFAITGGMIGYWQVK